MDEKETNVPNPVEFTLVANGGTMFKRPNYTLCKAGDLEAELSGGFIGIAPNHLQVKYLDGEEWEIILTTGNSETQIGWSGNIRSPRGLEAAFSPMTGSRSPKKVLLTETTSVELRPVGARMSLYGNGRHLGEFVPVWKDSDAEVGIVGRAYVDRTTDNVRRTGLVLLTISQAIRMSSD